MELGRDSVRANANAKGSKLRDALRAGHNDFELIGDCSTD